MPVTIICTQCGTPFKVPPARVKLGARLCSRACMALDKKRPIEQRYWSKVVIEGPTINEELGHCWGWSGDAHEHGYGRLWTPSRRPLYAHRVSWELHNGLIPDGMDVLHKCDNPPCSRPDHLFLGDQAANNTDRDAKDRVRHGDSHPSARLTFADVERARLAYSTGLVRQQELAERLGVSLTTVNDFLTGRTWNRGA